MNRRRTDSSTLPDPRAWKDVDETFAALVRDKNALLDALKAILRHGHLANVSAGAFYPPGGKPNPTQDVWAIPRHMLPDIEAVIAEAERAK